MIVFPFFAFGNEDGWFECSENIFHLGSIRPAKVVKLYYFPKQLGTYMINLLSIVEIIYSKLTLLESLPMGPFGSHVDDRSKHLAKLVKIINRDDNS